MSGQKLLCLPSRIPECSFQGKCSLLEQRPPSPSCFPKLWGRAIRSRARPVPAHPSLRGARDKGAEPGSILSFRGRSGAAPLQGAMEDKRNIPIIEWEHLDKRKFYVFGICMTMMIRVSVYPFTLIRTRLQVQKGKSLYNGTFDAFVKILRTEGTAGLYRGFLVNTFTLISGQCYVTTYELTRKYVARYNNNNAVKSLVAGGSASLVAQSITVPIDVISQHLMMQRKGESMGRFKVQNPDGKRMLVFGQTKDIIVQIFKADGFRGFYRGYVASLLTYIPNSAVWWPFYHFYAEQLSSLTPKDCPHLLLQAISGPLAAATASTLTNPMDVIRARVQVEGKSSIILTFKQLMAEEGPWGLTKGLSARIISATPSTIVIVVGYETLKKLSLRPELVDSRHW
ncbi:Solute carrier family 25 member 44 [Aix galericulata]|nr:Solute carrier family 25 member 44 [Aix galericulata]